MIWFLLAAAVSVAAFDWSGGGGSRRFWVTASAALAAFGLSLAIDFPGAGGDCPPEAGLLCRGGFVAFAGLTLLSTALLGAGAVYRRLSPSSFVVFVFSDLSLIFAVWAHRNDTASWALPSPGDWGAASAWGAGAALLRLAAPLAASAGLGVRLRDPGGAGIGGPIRRLFRRRGGSWQEGTLREGALASIGWWQGALLAWWVGFPAGALLALGGLALWPGAVVFSRSRIGSLSAAGGLLAVASAYSAAAPGLASLGLAGVALALGEPVVGLWAVAVLPLSIVTTLDLPSLFTAVAPPGATGRGASPYPVFELGFAVLFPLAWSYIPSTPRQVVLRGPTRPGALLALSAAAGTALVSASAPGWGTWLLAGAASAGLAARKVAGRQPAIARGRQAGQGATFPDAMHPQAVGGTEGLPKDAAAPETATKDERGLLGAASRLLGGDVRKTLPGWGLFVLALVLFMWLLWTGLETLFL